MGASYLVLCLLVSIQACRRERPASRDERGAAPQPDTLAGDPLSVLGLKTDEWGRWETSVPNKRQWLERAGVPDVPADSSGLAAYHILDLNADDPPDIVHIAVACSGENCVAEEMEPQTSIYLAAGTRFVRAGDVGDVSLLARQSPRQAPTLVTIVNQDVGAMCSDPLRKLVFHRPLAPADTAITVAEEVDYVELPGLRWPPVRLRTPLPMRVAQDQYNLRAAPVVDDTTSFEGCLDEPHRGNVIATFRIGATVLALAQEQVGERLWYLVETAAGGTFTSPFVEGSAVRLMGWMSSRYLETVPSPP